MFLYRRLSKREVKNSCVNSSDNFANPLSPYINFPVYVRTCEVNRGYVERWKVTFFLDVSLRSFTCLSFLKWSKFDETIPIAIITACTSITSQLKTFLGVSPLYCPHSYLRLGIKWNLFAGKLISRVRMRDMD